MAASIGPRWRTAAATVAAAALVGTGGTWGTSASAATTPPCTKPAFVAGLRRGATRLSQGRVVRPWGCAGHFAYAAVIFEGNEMTILFRARGRVWETASRAKYCTNGSVPARIWSPACNTN